jgi:hypothetical protein
MTEPDVRAQIAGEIYIARERLDADVKLTRRVIGEARYLQAVDARFHIEWQLLEIDERFVVLVSRVHTQQQEAAM